MSRDQMIEYNCEKRGSHDVPRFTRALIYIYFILTFFEPYLNGVVGSVTKYYIFVLMVVIALTTKKIKVKPYHSFMLFWLIYKAITLLWTTDYTIFHMHVLSQLGMVALFCVLTAIPYKTKTIEGIINSMFFGSAMIGFLSLFLNQPYHGIFESRRVLVLFGQEADPNNQAAFLAVGIAIGLCYLFIERHHRLLSLVVIIINFYSLLLTGSRGGFVTVAFMIFTIVILKSNRPFTKRKLRRLVAVCILSIIGFVVAIYFLPDDIYERIFSFATYQGGSERDMLWRNAWDLYWQGLFPIFGAGWGAYYSFGGVNSVVHNTYLMMLCDVGIIGSFAFFYPMGKVALYLVRKKEVLPICIFLAGMIPSVFLDAINKRFFWNSIIFVFIFYNYIKLNDRVSFNERNRLE